MGIELLSEWVIKHHTATGIKRLLRSSYFLPRYDFYVTDKAADRHKTQFVDIRLYPLPHSLA